MLIILAEVSVVISKNQLAKQFGNNVKFWRTKRGFSQSELADAVNISKDHCVQVEAGNRAVSLYVLYGISEALNVSVDSLLFGEKREKNANIQNIIKTLNSIEPSQISRINDIITIIGQICNDKDVSTKEDS